MLTLLGLSWKGSHCVPSMQLTIWGCLALGSGLAGISGEVGTTL